MKVKDPDPFSRRIIPDVPVVAGQAEEADIHQREHFRTDHLLTNLKKHTISSGAVTLSAQAGKFVLNMVSTMVLARLLTPRDFGLVAMVATVTGFLRVFKDAGLSVATVQRERITHAQVSNLFWINLCASLLSGGVLAALAPAIAWFYRNPRLLGIALFLSATFVISGTTVQHQALLKRQMRFKAIATIDIGSMVIGVLTAVLMALAGFGYWSLVASSLATEITGFLLTWSISRWRPQLPSRGSGIGPMVSFGATRTAGDLISTIARGTDNLLIGRSYGSGSVGLYTRATALLIRPLEQFLNPINAVFIPTLSRLQSQPQRYRSTFLQVYEAIALLGCFFTGLLCALSGPVVRILLGPKWDEAAVIFGGFTVAALCVPLANSAIWLFTSQGRGKDMLIAQVINSCVTVVSFALGLPFGPVGVAAAFSVASLLIRLPLLYYMVGRRGPVRTSDLWLRFFRYVPLWIVVFMVTWLTKGLVVDLRPFAQLLICAVVGLIAAAAFVASFGPQRTVAIHLLATVRELRKKGR
jgi:O-antigen/teichoic acid export membrane protein